MNEDNQILLFSFFIFYLVFGGIILLRKNNKKVIIINLSIHIIISSIFWYEYENVGPGGGSFVVWFFWLVFNGVHTLILILFLLFYLIRKNNN